MKHAYHGKADGILEKPGSVKEIRSAIKTVLSGENYYSLHVMKNLLSHETAAPFRRHKS
jgi:DNA-binding NarL/FixJ family response regulator